MHGQDGRTFFLYARLVVDLLGAESGLNGFKAVIPAFPLHFCFFLLLLLILMFVNTLFLYINVCIVH